MPWLLAHLRNTELPVRDACGDALGVDKSRRFTGLSGYKKVLDCGVEALGILDVPCFYPEQAAAAVAAPRKNLRDVA